MVAEALAALAVQPGGRYLDCTLGAGGHADAILKHSAPGGQLLGLDADPEAIEISRERLKKYGNSVLTVNSNFDNLQATCIKYDFFPVHGILFDLGLSSRQLSEMGRGFSFQYDSPLDMRFDPQQKVSADDIINDTSEEYLSQIIKSYGEEIFSQRIAASIVRSRPIKTTKELADLIEKAVGGRKGKIHPATKTFQALRIAVNLELDKLEAALKQAIDLLGFNGRLVVISYHSLEDRIVKQFMQRESRGCICPPGLPSCVCHHVPSLRIINKKVITPSPAEIKSNPRSRSAKLRAAERISAPGDSYAATDNQDFINLSDTGGWRRPALLKKIKMVFLAS
jgi:16S rRNA (cytosine1402-N4)-methyltransferase